jgi:hypothetical protein
MNAEAGIFALHLLHCRISGSGEFAHLAMHSLNHAGDNVRDFSHAEEMVSGRDRSRIQEFFCILPLKWILELGIYHGLQ